MIRGTDVLQSGHEERKCICQKIKYVLRRMKNEKPRF